VGDLTDVNAETPNDNDVLSWDAGTNRWIAVTGGVSGFIGLSDTPANYAGSAGYFLRVNATPDAVEFRSPAEVLSDLSGQAGAAFSWNSQDLTSVGDIQVGNGKYVGVSGDARIAYDSTNHYLKVLGGDFFTDRWLSQESNTFLGVGVAGTGNLTHASGVEGYQNTGIGQSALKAITSGYRNVGIGFIALTSLTNGHDNMGLGAYALSSNTGGDNNVGIGYKSLESNISGNANMGLGAYALSKNTANSKNVGVGYFAGWQTTGSGNIYLGNSAGKNVTSGSYNIIIGYELDAQSPTADYQLSIGDIIRGHIDDKEVYLACPTAICDDADLVNGEVSFAVDEANHELDIKVKYSDGTVKTGTVSLS